jgi:hypothetical protein
LGQSGFSAAEQVRQLGKWPRRKKAPASRDPLLILAVLGSNNSPEIRQFIARMGAASCRRSNIGSSRTSACTGQKLRGAIGRSASSYRWPRLGLKQPLSRIVANSGKPPQAYHKRVLAIPPRRDFLHATTRSGLLFSAAIYPDHGQGNRPSGHSRTTSTTAMAKTRATVAPVANLRSIGM